MAYFDSNYWLGFGFGGLARDLMREAAIQADLRKQEEEEWHCAEICRDTLLPQAILRWIVTVGDQPQWKGRRK